MQPSTLVLGDPNATLFSLLTYSPFWLSCLSSPHLIWFFLVLVIIFLPFWLFAIHFHFHPLSFLYFLTFLWLFGFPLFVRTYSVRDFYIPLLILLHTILSYHLVLLVGPESLPSFYLWTFSISLFCLGLWVRRMFHWMMTMERDESWRRLYRIA